MKSSIINRVKSLPPLPKTIIDINRVFEDEESGVHDLAKIIETDPMIIANLLKTANSPLYGFGKEITTVSQAVGLFGMNLTRSIALGYAIRKLLNVDMQPYGITPEEFADISSLQAVTVLKWYKQIDAKKADKLYLAALLQATGKILIASEIIQDDETTSFSSEIKTSNNIALVEKSYVDVTSSEVTALIFEHWEFDEEFIDMIEFSDNPSMAPSDVKEFATALNIVKTAVPVNNPLSDLQINIALKKARDAGYNHELLEDAIDDILDVQ